MLKGMANRVGGDEDLVVTSGIIALACKYIASFGKFILNLPTAVALIELLQVCRSQKVIFSCITSLCLQVINSHDTDVNGEHAKANRKQICRICVLHFIDGVIYL